MGEDYSTELYGDLSTAPTHERTTKVYTKIQDLTEALTDSTVNLRARIHNSRVKGNLAFLVLRDHYYTV